MHITFYSRPHSQHSGLAYDKGPSDCGITAVEQHTGPPHPEPCRAQTPHAACCPQNVGSLQPLPPPQCDAPTGWPSSTPKGDPLGATKAVFPLPAGHGPGSWSPHSHQNRMPSHRSSLFPIPQLLAPPTLNTCQRGAPSRLWPSGRSLSGSSPGQCRLALGHHPVSGPQTESFHLRLPHRRTCLVSWEYNERWRLADLDSEPARVWPASATGSRNPLAHKSILSRGHGDPSLTACLLLF